MHYQAKWIFAKDLDKDTVPMFERRFALPRKVKEARLFATALGVYETYLNGCRVGDFVLAPGWTTYRERLQVQEYDVTELLKQENRWTAYVGRGWYSSPLGWTRREDDPVFGLKKVFFAELHLTYEDGTQEVIATDEGWSWGESRIRFSEIYNGEHFDANIVEKAENPVSVLEHPTSILIDQEGEIVTEQERVAARRVFQTPKGEILVDFGQEVTGYAEFSLEAKQGDQIVILHGEVLDQEGCFYNANYRSAKAEIRYICREGAQTYHPRLTFYGFRFIKLDKWPQAFEMIRPEQFTAIQVNSRMKRTGWIETSSGKLNQLFSNVIWSQKDNFLDVPTDCPQRDERMGWTGDAQQFIKTASYNFDVERFFIKWLHDLAAEQFENGGVPHVIPNALLKEGMDYDDPALCATGWGDAATICPHQIYMTYGNRQILADQWESMTKWVDYITAHSQTPYLWTGGTHFADWLGLDAPVGSYKGSSREDFLASAFYAHSIELVIQAGRVLGKEVKAYEELQRKVKETFGQTFPTYQTQTEHVLALRFGLCQNPEKTAKDLAAMVQRDGSMKTGFLGTPYLLYMLSDYGYSELAYELLLREEYPSWLYAVNKGATTTWEHWDSIMEDGSFWSTDMNSFNHYSYGSVMAWVYERAAGIEPLEPGFARIRIAPVVTERLEWVKASIDTRAGRVASSWRWVEGRIRYDVELPADGEVCIGEKRVELKAGRYTFWS